jgi:hypothetical protein
MAVSARAASPIDARSLAGRRVGPAALLGVIIVVLALAVPALQPVGREIREMNWLSLVV